MKWLGLFSRNPKKNISEQLNTVESTGLTILIHQKKGMINFIKEETGISNKIYKCLNWSKKMVRNGPSWEVSSKEQNITLKTDIIQ